MGDNPTDTTAIKPVSSTSNPIKHPNLGSSLEDVLSEFGILEEATKVAKERVAKWQSENHNQHIHEKAYYKGYRDFLHGRLDCPYRKDSLVAKEWQRGQNAAYFKNLEKLKNGSLMRKFYKKKSQAKNKTSEKAS